MTPIAIARWAPAKVNLCLHVTGRRSDGYHELDSLVAFADLGDRLVAVPAANGAFLRVTCGNMPVCEGSGVAVVPLGTTNLAWRALAAGAAALGGTPGVTVTLDKRLPAGAGLGGGSSDAAAVLRALIALDGRTPPPAQDAATLGAARLGADVPMCLDPRPWRARGLGEILTPIVLAHDLSAVLVWPGRAVATPAVFQARTGGFGGPVPDEAVARLADDPIGALAGLRNDLTEPACRVEPLIAVALQAVGECPGCRLARMSGSGSAVFGLFDDDAAAARAADDLAALWPGWWVRATVLRARPRSD